jgi:hypothetical protein
VAGKRLAIGAKACGYGPVAKAATIIRGLPQYDYVFLGTGTALEYVQHEKRLNLEAAVDVERLPCADLLLILQACDGVVSVMDERLALAAFDNGIPYWFVDSLFGFWKLDRPLGEIVTRAHTLRASRGHSYDNVRDLSIHEQKLLAHCLANRTFVQRHPGIDQRLSEFASLGIRSIQPVGSIIDSEDVIDARSSTTDKESKGNKDLLFNLGGFTNFILDADNNGAYLRLMEAVARRLLECEGGYERIILCAGAYSTRQTIDVCGRQLELCVLPHPELMRAAHSCLVYATTPGLTSIHEAALLGRLPLLLPEEHYGHVWNVEMLGNATIAESAIRLADIVPDFILPDNDYEGSAALIELARRILASDDLVVRLTDVIQRSLTLTKRRPPVATSQAINELGRMFAGPDLRLTLRAAIDGHR